MTKDEFRHALRLGLGRAVLHARSHSSEEYRQILLDACLHCSAYDIQTEGTRAPYLYEIVSALPDREFYFDAVLASLSSAKDNPDGVQRFRLASFLAEDAYPGAREALYRHCRVWPTWFGHIAYGFVDLDGIDGLLFVAGKMGEVLARGVSAAEVGWVVRHAYEKLGKQNCLDALGAAASSNPHIAAFLRELPTFDGDLERPVIGGKEAAALGYGELLSRMGTLSRGRLMSWGKKAPDSELHLAAEGLAATRDPAVQLNHLHLFARRAFPLNPGPLLALAAREDTARAAIVALAHVADVRVRDLALQLIRAESDRRGLAIDLLLENFQAGDHDLALAWFMKEADEEVVHSLGMGLEHLWERHPAPESATVMRRALYEKGRCSVCRERAVRRMIESGTLPDEYRLECAYDCNDDIRAMVGASQEADAPTTGRLTGSGPTHAS